MSIHYSSASAAAAAVVACREQVCEARDAEREALREQVRRIGALELARDHDADNTRLLQT